MNNTIKIIVGLLVVVTIGSVVYYEKTQMSVNDNPPIVINDSIKGCYIATLSKDVYTLIVSSQEGETFGGTLTFKNFEKDSSSGTFVGTYKNGIVLGDYSFQSEGMNSVMQVIFKKVGNDFVRGYGDLNSTGDRFVNLDNITYDTSAVFKATPDCSAPSTAQTKLLPGSLPVVSSETIQSTTWIWQKTIMNDGLIITPKKTGAFTITLGTDSKATGKTDCNSFFASYHIGSDGVIKFENIGSTKMFCEGSQEAIFTNEIGQVSHYITDSSGNLILLLPYDSGSILFKK